MSISLHCQSCRKKIKAPDGSGGKYGKCPHCNHRNYIPLPKKADEGEIVLAPVDESEETKYAELMHETFELSQEILTDRDLPDEPKSGVEMLGSAAGERDLLKHIVVYLIQMAHGDLDAAGGSIKKILPFKKQADDLIERLKTASVPEPELAEIPAKVLDGLIKNLKLQLK